MLGHDMTTYIYIRPDGKCVHSNACYAAIGKEYEHDNPDWQPPKDWPYKIKDMRIKEAPPVMAQSTSVQVKMLEEFGTAPGTGGSKPGLIDVKIPKRRSDV